MVEQKMKHGSDIWMVLFCPFAVGTNTTYISIPKLDSSSAYGLYLKLDTNKYELSGNYYVKSYG